MPVITIADLDRYGIIYDRAAHTIPPEAFSGGANIRFREGGAERVEGHNEIYSPLSIAPKWIEWFPPLANPHWVYSNGAKMYCVNGSTHANITRQAGGLDEDYTLSTTDRWSACYLNGLGVFNHSGDIPQMWSNISTGTKLTNLLNWPTAQRAKVIRSFKVFLIALGPTLPTGEQLPSAILWSSPAEANQPPVSWDYASPSTLAGLKHLSETGGVLVDALKLGDHLILYKDDSAYALQFTPSRAVFNDYLILPDVGLLGQDCVVNTPKGHALFALDDIILHRGQRGTEQSLVSERQRKWIFRTMDEDNYVHNYVTTHPLKKEVLFCFTQTGYAYPNIALVWNWETGSVGFRDLAEFSYGTTGSFIEIEPATTWDADSATWDTDDTIWGDGGLGYNIKHPVFADFTNSKMFRLGGSQTFNGASFISYIERTGLTVFGQDYKGTLVADPSLVKLVRGLYPNFEAESGTEIVIQVGSQMELSDPITWSDPQTFVVGEDYLVDVVVSGRYLAVRFQTTGDKPWKLNSYGLDITVTGKH